MSTIRALGLIGLITVGAPLLARAQAAEAAPPEPQEINPETPGVRWVAPIGYRSGQFAVDVKHVVVGTNGIENDKKKPPFHEGGTVVCFDRATGKRLWQRDHPWRGVPERPYLGIQSTPVIADDHVYYLSNRGEFVCLKVADGALVWSIDMVADLGVSFSPDWALSNKFCTPLVHGEYVYCVTGQGLTRASPPLEKRHLIVADKPEPPHFLCVNKHTGKIAWGSSIPGWKANYSWSSPVLCRVGRDEAIAFPGGDGVLYFFEPTTGRLRLRHDLNPPGVTEWPNYTIPGKSGRLFVAAEPLVVGDTLYIGTAQTMYDYPKHAQFAALDLGRVLRGEPNVERWRIDPEKFGWLRIRPVVSKTRLFLLDDDTGELLAVDPKDGAIRGRREVLEMSCGPFGSINVIGEELFVASGAGLSVYTADERLELLRQYEFEGGPESPGGYVIGELITSGDEYFTATDAGMFAMDAKLVRKKAPP